MKKLVPAAVVLVLIVAGGVAFLLTRSDDDTSDAGLLVAARTGAANFFSLDYRHADADVDRVLALATGTFKKEYAAKRTEVVSSVVAKKLVVTAVVPERGAALEFRTATAAQVLVAVDVSTSASGGGATPDRYRTRVQLKKVGDRWLISDLNQVG